MEKESKITYDLIEFERRESGINIPKYWADISTLGKNYEDDIGGVDMGFNSLVLLSNSAFIIQDSANTIGFILGQSRATPRFDGEKSFCPVAAYLKPEYRTKTGKHTNIMKNALVSLMDILEDNDFDRLNVIPNKFGSSGMVTKMGMEHVLKPLYALMHNRIEELGDSIGEEGVSHLMAGSGNELYGAGFDPEWRFSPESFDAKTSGSNTN